MVTELHLLSIVWFVITCTYICKCTVTYLKAAYFVICFSDAVFWPFGKEKLKDPRSKVSRGFHVKSG